jgi:N-acetyl-anhydromuramyl-L-alanine amidase AmpD
VLTLALIQCFSLGAGGMRSAGGTIGAGAVFFLGDVYDDLRDAAAQAVYIGVLRNLVFFKQKLAKSYGPPRTVIDEIVLHGTESKASQEQSATYLQSVIGIHYFIGRDSGLAYRIVPDEYQSFHAGNPKHHSKVQDHNPKSIGIEMYQQDISVFKNDASKLDFTDWQYQTVAILCYHICHRWNIPRTNIVGHGEVNPVDRSPDEPRNFDWDRFNRNLDDTSSSLVGLLGPDFALPR